jgi:hypothetical protein
MVVLGAPFREPEDFPWHIGEGVRRHAECSEGLEFGDFLLQIFHPRGAGFRFQLLKHRL